MIIPSHTAGKTYAVLGLGKSGVASALALQAAGATVLAWDDMAASRAAAEAVGITLHDLHKVDWRTITALVREYGPDSALPSILPLRAGTMNTVARAMGSNVNGWGDAGDGVLQGLLT